MAIRPISNSAQTSSQIFGLRSGRPPVNDSMAYVLKLLHHNNPTPLVLELDQSGKSKLLKASMEYAKGFCNQLNVNFDANMIRITAYTGVDAMLINGEIILKMQQ